MKLSAIISLFLLMYFPANAQTNTLFKSELVVRDTVNERQARPEFDLERDNQNRLYQRSANKLIFQQPKNWYYPFYEIYNEEFILITNISEEMSVYAIYKYLAKHEVVIIDLQNLERKFTCNIRGADLNSIYMRGEQVYVKLGEPVCEEIKCDVFTD